MLFSFNEKKKTSYSATNNILIFAFIFSIHLIFVLPAYVINLPVAFTFNIVFSIFIFCIFVIKNFDICKIRSNKLSF